jgi:hypothetical protein
MRTLEKDSPKDKRQLREYESGGGGEVVKKYNKTT